LLGLLEKYDIFILLGLVCINIIFIISILILSSKNKGLKRKFMNLTRGQEFKSLEELILNSLEKIDNLEEQNRTLTKQLNILRENSRLAIQKYGIVRYNAFENVGSNLSFAMCLLDSYDNGIVINGIFSREGTSVFAKPIEEGKSKYPLSAEEIQAIDMAKRNFYLKEIKE